MRIIIPKSIPNISEIDYVLRCINWRRQPPDEIRVIRSLPGGRSRSEVFESLVKWKNREFLKVVKIGPAYDLKNEMEGFEKIREIIEPNVFFARIEAATPRVYGNSQTELNERDAIVYTHVKDWFGSKELKTFEDIAYLAVKNGGSELEKATQLLETLFNGIQAYLYKDCENTRTTSLMELWNLRLGPDGTIEVEECDPVNQLLKVGSPSKSQLKDARVYPRDVTPIESWKDGNVKPGDFVFLTNLNIMYQGDQLTGKDPRNALQFNIVARNKKIRGLTEGSSFNIYGKLKSIRAVIYKNLLLNNLKEIQIEDKLIKGPGTIVPDPFKYLPYIFGADRTYIITSLVHGDLNPRNILVTENGQPCLIDYAHTKKGEPLLSDFVRLEGCLARDILHKDITWQQHVRLQRLLTAACRLGDIIKEKTMIEKFTQSLAQDRSELASAFCLFYAIRKASKHAYPQEELNQWYRDYLEQLFLFVYLTLKWEEESLKQKKKSNPKTIRATAAMAGVASEAISEKNVYRWWNLEDLNDDGQEIIKLLKNTPESALLEMANLATGIDHWKEKEREHLSGYFSSKYNYIQDKYLHESAIDVELNAKLRDSFVSEFEGLRDKFVRMAFVNNANAILSSLKSKKAHESYISLCAYIDLKGKISPARARTWLTFEESLQDERLLAEQEMRRLGGEDKDAIDSIAEKTEVVLIGEAGGGKSTVAREWKFRLAESIKGEGGDKKYTPRLPIYVLAPDLPARLKNWSKENPQSIVDVITDVIRRDQNSQDSITTGMLQNLHDFLTVGAVHLIVDSLNELDEGDKQKVVDWIISLRITYRRTPVLVCHREYTYMLGLLPFPVITLQKVNEDQAKKYIFNYLRENNVINHEIIAGQLIKFLLEEGSEHVRELAQTPLFLWMIVNYYQEKKTIPKNRGELFKQFSEWYIEERYHTEHGEPVHYKYGPTYKGMLLGVIGYELVKRSTTYIAEKEVESIVPEIISEQGTEILKEIIDSEMLKRNNEKLEFLHQAFQEYFAACHFLEYEATDEDSIREKVKRPYWYYTFETLLGFAGESPNVVSQIIKTALGIDPELTARFLRVAEGVDPELLNQFIKTQEQVLRDPQAGSFAHKRAAITLSQYGRDPVFKILIGLGSDLKVPIESRIEILRHLSNIQIPYSELKKIEREKELEDLLEQVFRRPEDSKIHLICIDVVRTLNFKNLNDYLVGFIENEEAEWTLRRAAWDACEKMGIKLIARRKEIYTKACLKRLEQAEAELFLQTSNLDEMKELNEERCYLLKQIASPPNLPVLLARRFSLEIHNAVEKIVDDVVKKTVESPAGIERAWEILKTQTADEITIEEWLSLIRECDDLVAEAIAYQLARMAKQGKELPSHRLQDLLDLELRPERLLLVAELISASGKKALVEELDQFLRDFIRRTKTSKEFEALARLAFALKGLDSQRGRHLITVAISFFYPDQKELPEGVYPLLLMNNQTSLSDEDIKILINRGGEDARAAIFQLEISGAYDLLLAIRGTITKLDKTSLQKIQTLAESETRLEWQCFFAIAATKVHAFELLPWLIEIVKKTSYAQDGSIDYYSESFEKFRESLIGMILRAIGYLARLLRDNKDREARPAMEFLHEYYRNLSKNADRKIIRGITTALGFLGEWKLILENLSPGEPWMYEAANNIFKYWVSPLKKYEYWKAACWILQYREDHPKLAPDVRSTLEKLKKDFDDELRYIITSPDDDFPLTPEEKKIYEIEELFENKDISYFSRKVSELLTSSMDISEDIYLKLNKYLSDLIPHFPKAILKYDTSLFGHIIEKIWAFAEKHGLEKEFGTNVFRWYEHHRYYSKAREVLQRLVDIARKNNNKSDEAIFINNLAYEYLLEEKWKEAAPLFKQAAEIFYEEKDMYNFYNSRANYLMCQIENNNIDDIEAMEKEIKSITEKLTEKDDWHARKPYILLAKLKEKRGNIKEAMRFAEKAISITKDSQTTYFEEDQKYLESLRGKL